jgi:hypothetical protein
MLLDDCMEVLVLLQQERLWETNGARNDDSAFRP